MYKTLYLSEVYVVGPVWTAGSMARLLDCQTARLSVVKERGKFVVSHK